MLTRVRQRMLMIPATMSASNAWPSRNSRRDMKRIAAANETTERTERLYDNQRKLLYDHCCADCALQYGAAVIGRQRA